MYNGAHLASATVPWHWLFFCPAPKFGAYFNKKSQSPEVHWLILDPMGALENVLRKKIIKALKNVTFFWWYVLLAILHHHG